MKNIPEKERWLYKNKKALASVIRGLKESADPTSRRTHRTFLKK